MSKLRTLAFAAAALAATGLATAANAGFYGWNGVYYPTCYYGYNWAGIWGYWCD